MIESFLNDVVFVLALCVTAVMMLFVLGITGIGLIARHMYRDTQKQGGVKKVATKVVAGTAATYARRALVKRWLG